MTWRLVLRLAWRNLWRHARRTLLTALAFAAGVFLLIVFLGLGDGMHDKMIETGVRLGTGHVVVEPAGAREQIAVDLTLSRSVTEAVDRVLAAASLDPDLKGSAPRLLVSGLLSSATNSTGVQVVGMDPTREANLSLLPDRLVEGRYLGADGPTPPVVIGRALAEKLDVGIESKLVLMTQAGAEIQSQLLRVRGVFETGMENVDGHLVGVLLLDLQALLARPGALSHEAVFLRRADDAERVRDVIAAKLRGQPVRVLTWREAMPQLDQFIALDDAGNYVFNAVLLIMVTLGVLNTVLMGVLERQRELGLLAALGMRPRAISVMVIAETMLLTALGAGIGLLAGLAAHRYFAVHGFNMALVSQETFTVAGVAVDMVVKSYLYPGRIPWSLAFIAALGLLAAVYPALRAARTLPTEAMRDL